MVFLAKTMTGVSHSTDSVSPPPLLLLLPLPPLLLLPLPPLLPLAAAAAARFTQL